MNRSLASLTAACLWISLTIVTVPRAFAVPAKGHKFMVTGPSPYAVEVARDVAARGGNAVDMAVAAALSLAVTHPYYGSLGGGGFAVVKTNAGGVEAIDFREVAPKAARPQMFATGERSVSITGGLAVGVPGVPAGLWELHQKRGKLHWSRLFKGVIDLASKGFAVSGEWADITQRQGDRFSPAGKRIFLRGGRPLKPGETLKQPELAKLLREMSARGVLPFYRGLAARDIVATVKANGGNLSLEDMREYKARWLAPLKAEYRGFEIWSMPPPSSGGVISQSALRILDAINSPEAKPLSIDEFHRIGEALKFAFRGRTLLGDPSFVKNPTEALLAPAYIAAEAKRFQPDKATDVETLKTAQSEHDQTTHLSVMTADGEAVAMTVTLNGSYGSGVVSEKFGVALNNEMDDFSTKPGEPNMYGLIQGEPNSVEPGKRPLSSMSPTIVTKDGKAVISVGSPGGPRIISAVTQTLYRLLAQNLNVDQAVQAPRVHHQVAPNVLYVDAGRFSPETLDALRAKGHVVDSGSTAKAYAIRLNADGILEGAYDSRGEGAAGGL